MKIFWTRNALDDLHDIRRYLKESQSIAYAKKITLDILAEVNSLEQQPGKGSFVRELEDLHLTTHRQLLAGQHRIIIECAPGGVIYVHLIAHTSRDLEALIRRRLLNS
ncbi:type II toxin-antitoxin system RelE/ParE family toxin [Pseudoduganella sp. OTU4001]|uniref:type II toxin-antitoxin system RelE/ParE family toxin n=1 Tax=Pseudoduganella sp. OTU4001 TaxID=3043854 RepID=UPI00313AB1CC